MYITLAYLRTEDLDTFSPPAAAAPAGADPGADPEAGASSNSTRAQGLLTSCMWRCKTIEILKSQRPRAKGVYCINIQSTIHYVES